jgi:hypothetical protein
VSGSRGRSPEQQREHQARRRGLVEYWRPKINRWPRDVDRFAWTPDQRVLSGLITAVASRHHGTVELNTLKERGPEWGLSSESLSSAVEALVRAGYLELTDDGVRLSLPTGWGPAQNARSLP